MTGRDSSPERLLGLLTERAKELDCLYRIQAVLRDSDTPLSDVSRKIVDAIPSGYQYSDICRVKIVVEGDSYCSRGFAESDWVQRVDIPVQGETAGSISVYYLREMPDADDGPFLKEEIQLLQTIAGRLGSFVEHQRMVRNIGKSMTGASCRAEAKRVDWQKALNILKQTDQELYQSIARKMMNHLLMGGMVEAARFSQRSEAQVIDGGDDLSEDWNVPHQRRKQEYPDDLGALVFTIAPKHLDDDRIQTLIQKWLQESKLAHLDRVVNGNYSLTELAAAIRLYYPDTTDEPVFPSAGRKGVLVSLIRRLLSDQLQYIKTAKDFIEVSDICRLLERVICYPAAQGKLGGKSAGMYLAAQILKKRSRDAELLSNVRIPRTWHITSEAVLRFVRYNGFDDVVEQKYKDLDQIRLEYPYIVQTFKSARFPPDLLNGLTVALDDLGGGPLIVRSSSLLEDRVGAAFSGKYRSLFLANQGSRHNRLDALVDAVAEVYASTFSPDAIEYRAERGLLDFVEEMGIMIQEVVGNKVGKYFLPTFAGVAFSSNEFRWSPRIKREDGLLRLVPGLGTRAVDRLSDDYPVLVAPGQPGLRVNACVEELLRYAPKKIDVINLETNSLETCDVGSFLAEVGNEIPGVENIVSVVGDGQMIRRIRTKADLAGENVVVTFEGLISRTPFVKQMRTILGTLEQALGMPVDIEFGSDGRDLYLLQCRPQSSSRLSGPASIPRDTPKDRIVFTAHRLVSNGYLRNITHIVYVDGANYEKLAGRSEMIAVGRAVGKLNKLLPKKQFILMGPGRWGSRGDIKLGVSIGYSDINNTAALIEVARKKGDYVPDLSFGTHFFQDLVEANIRYLPLYPDDQRAIFDEKFLTNSANILVNLLPEYGALSNVIRVINVPASSGGMVLNVLMNADLDEAMGLLSHPSYETGR